MGNNSWKKKRRVHYLYTRKSFYIFCEGTKTEISYFNSFKDKIEGNPLYNKTVFINPVGVGRGTTSVIDYGEKYIKKNNIESGDIYFLYDKDSFSKQEFDKASSLVDNLNKTNKNNNIHYHACWSNECFELWFLLHFSRYDVDNGRKAYFDRLDLLLTKHNKGKYDKAREDMYDFLTNYGDINKAIKYAKDLQLKHVDKTPSNSVPCTKVYLLVEELLKYMSNA